MRKLLVCILFFGVSLSAQEPQDPRDDLLQRIVALIAEFYTPPEPPRPIDYPVPCGASIQEAYNGAIVTDERPAPRLLLEPGCTYEETLTFRPKVGLSESKRILITSRSWTDKGTGWDGMVTPADGPRMATIRGVATTGHVLQIANGEGAGFVELFGIAIRGCAPNGHCDLLMLGDDAETDASRRARFITARQLLLLGDPVFGSRRGARIEACDVLFTQSWVQDIFITGQDTQAVASSRGGCRVEVSFSYLEAASENFLLGGGPVPSADFIPTDWYLHDVILPKPLRWREEWRAGTKRRQVKNNFELKHVRGFRGERILAVNNWPEAQSGIAVLLNYTTNGTCPACGGIEDAHLRDLVVLNSPGGLAFQGHSYSLLPTPSNNINKLLRVSVENAYFALTATGTTSRTMQVTNVLNRHDIRVSRATFRCSTSNWLVGDYGQAWRYDEPTNTYARIPGGPTQGLRLTDLVVACGGRYGITAPSGSHDGSGFGAFVSADGQIAGSVFGDPTTTQLTNYNRHTAGGEANVRWSRAAMLAELPVDACGQLTVSSSEGGEGPLVKGADCSVLNEVVSWKRFLREP